MRIPDDIEELVLAFMEPEMKKGLMHMTREEINDLIMREIGATIEQGHIQCASRQSFPYIVTPKGKEILQILAPCKRSGR